MVGADGRNSTIANLVGARKYNLTPNERFAYWAFFEGADPCPEPAFVQHRWDERLVFGRPPTAGCIRPVSLPTCVSSHVSGRTWRAASRSTSDSCEPVAQALRSARRVGKIFGMLRWEGFFREASGPGWVLAGDAGHFKDPTPGQGIQDAFRQVDALAPTIAGALHDSGEDLDHALADWVHWRDRDAAGHYWLATDMGRAGAMPTVLPEMQKRLLEQGKIDVVIDLFTHRSHPSQVITPPRLLGATGRLLLRPGCQRRNLLREVGALIRTDVRRKRLNRRPAYVAAASCTDAGPTEMQDSAMR